MKSIIESIRDTNLLGGFLGKDLSTWTRWMVALRALYGIRLRTDFSRQLVRECTGRDVDLLPEEGFGSALFLTGRRSGKSRIAAVIGAYEATLSGHESKLAKGERGIVAILAPTKQQAKIVHGYVRAVFQARLLAGEIVREDAAGFDLSNGISIQIMAGDWRTIRGFSLIAAIVDEACFFGLSEESKVRSDEELIQAIRPGLATTGGKLVVISSPYAKKGWCYKIHQKCHGRDGARTLVWNCPSRTMNPTLPQSVVDEAMAEDLAAAKAEYLGEFRDDVSAFVSRETVEALVIEERHELPPSHGTRYVAFCDVSGGRSDDSALCIGHSVERVVIVDALRRWQAPHNPYACIAAMAEEIKKYGIRSIVGDNYSAEFVAAAFQEHGIAYTRCEKPKSELYRELLPRLTSAEVELLDEPVSVSQLANLERRTRSGGRDIIDHPPRAHDDMANTIAGVAVIATNQSAPRGALFPDPDEETDNNENEMIESHEY